MRRGVLTRRLRVREPGGRATQVDSRRFLHMGAAHLAALETTIVPENWAGWLRIRSEREATSRVLTNHGYIAIQASGYDEAVAAASTAFCPRRQLTVAETPAASRR
jgi:trehalose/maltose hydrolase-like predicted phosphorylase